jgi:hypothetical protein
VLADIDWVAASSITTAGATLVLAVATFVSVRSANRIARAAEQSLLAGLWPILVASRHDDPAQSVVFLDDYKVDVPGGEAVAEVTDDVVYLALAVRNVGQGLAVLGGWWFIGDQIGPDVRHAEPEHFYHVPRDHSVPAGDLGTWQGTFRDPADPAFQLAARTITDRHHITIEMLYSDHLGGQRTISRFTLVPGPDGRWFPSVSRHWNLDRPDPR